MKTVTIELTEEEIEEIEFAINERLTRLDKYRYRSSKNKLRCIQSKLAANTISQDVKPCENCGSTKHGIGGCQETFHP